MIRSRLAARRGSSHTWLTIRELTIWNSARKAAAASDIPRDAVVLAADTW